MSRKFKLENLEVKSVRSPDARYAFTFAELESYFGESLAKDAVEHMNDTEPHCENCGSMPALYASELHVMCADCLVEEAGTELVDPLRAWADFASTPLGDLLGWEVGCMHNHSACLSAALLGDADAQRQFGQILIEAQASA